jgi:hypothetical protein
MSENRTMNKEEEDGGRNREGEFVGGKVCACVG